MTAWHWFIHYTGVDDASGPWYAWWSGLFSDVGLFAALGIYAWHQNCHVKGCKRFKTRPVDGTAYKACKRHHPAMPDGHITEDHIRLAHERAKGRR